MRKVKRRRGARGRAVARSRAQAGRTARPGREARSRRPARDEPGVIKTAGTRVARHLSPRAADALGIGLVVVAVLAVLGLWFEAGGPFGRGFLVVMEGVFGPVGYAFPVVGKVWAGGLFTGAAGEVGGR